MGRHYSHLDLEERLRLADWLETGVPVAEIALKLDRSASTIYREIRRNRFVDEEWPTINGYYGKIAQRNYEERRAVHRKMIMYPQVKAAVIDRLKGGWSPEQIAGRMKHERHPVRVSHEAIYRFAYSPDGRAEEWYRHLPEHRRRRKPRGTRRHHGHRFDPERSIVLRPPEVSDRSQFGNWECDLMMFRKTFGTANVTTLVERVSRFTVLAKNRDRRSIPVMEELIVQLAPLPCLARRSITFDRGTEFTAWSHLKAGIGAEAWFCDPQSPWQKGSVENTNNRLRKYLPRKRDPNTLTTTYLRAVAEHLNTTPRKCLGYRTPTEVFRENLVDLMNGTA